eukprot:scaffold2343_cov25-Tisochrysis_lutea.AAC.2
MRQQDIGVGQRREGVRSWPLLSLVSPSLALRAPARPVLHRFCLACRVEGRDSHAFARPQMVGAWARSLRQRLLRMDWGAALSGGGRRRGEGRRRAPWQPTKKLVAPTALEI